MGSPQFTDYNVILYGDADKARLCRLCQKHYTIRWLHRSNYCTGCSFVFYRNGDAPDSITFLEYKVLYKQLERMFAETFDGDICRIIMNYARFLPDIDFGRHGDDAVMKYKSNGFRIYFLYDLGYFYSALDHLCVNKVGVYWSGIFQNWIRLLVERVKQNKIVCPFEYICAIKNIDNDIVMIRKQIPMLTRGYKFRLTHSGKMKAIDLLRNNMRENRKKISCINERDNISWYPQDIKDTYNGYQNDVSALEWLRTLPTEGDISNKNLGGWCSIS